MRKWLILMSIFTSSVLVLGFVGKCTFRDSGIISIRSIEDIQELNCNVNQLFTIGDVDSFIKDYNEMILEKLPESVEIFVIEPVNNIRQYNFTMTQEVKVVEVIRGEMSTDKRIELVTSGGIYDQKYKYHNYENSRPIFYGMMNLLFPDNLYLVFVTPLNINDYTKTMRYRMAFPLFGWFNLSDDDSVSISKPVNKILYNDFGHSEFLCDSPQTLEKLLQFKRKVISKYPSAVD